MIGGVIVEYVLYCEQVLIMGIWLVQVGDWIFKLCLIDYLFQFSLEQMQVVVELIFVLVMFVVVYQECCNLLIGLGVFDFNLFDGYWLEVIVLVVLNVLGGQ